MQTSTINATTYFLNTDGAVTAIYYGDNGEMVAGVLWCPTQGLVFG